MPDSLVSVRDRVSFSKLDEALPLPDLVGIQRESFDWLLAEGLKEVLEEVSPIEDFTEQFQLHFGKHAFKDQKFTEEECKDKDATFSAPLFVEAMFVNKTTGIPGEIDDEQNQSVGAKKHKELVLMALPKEVAKQRTEYFTEKTNSTERALKKNLQTDLSQGGGKAAAEGSIIIQ